MHRATSIMVAGLVISLIACGDDSSSGNQNSDAGTNTSALCGNGRVEGIEDCDEGSANSDTQPDACRADCTLPHCGDSVIDTDELCDDGPRNADEVPDACRSDCTLPRCGDGVVDVESGETCDDGNTDSDDGCSAVCLVEFCGNGVLDGDEVCDDGNTEPGDGCSPDCRSDETCGNGIVDAGEQCEDGNTDDTDDCRNDCTLPRCGDGIVDAYEQCDDGAANSNTTPGACRVSCQLPRCGDLVIDASLGEACDDGNLTPGDTCSATCQIEACGNALVDQGETCDCGTAIPSTIPGCDGYPNSDAPDAPCRTDCQPRHCGDGVLDAASGEDCDLTALGPDTCEDLGYHPGTLSCLPNCRYDTTACGGYCGDGIRNGDEVCDGAQLGGNTCPTEGYYGGTISCQSNCQLNLGQCDGSCGDGILNGNGAEACDHQDFGGLSCADYGYYTGGLTCSGDCQDIDPLAGCEQYCGDGVVNGTEECDGENVSGLYCVDFYGFDAGRVRCSPDCKFTFQDCYSAGWASRPSGTNADLFGIWGFAWNDIWIVGGSGTILHGRGGNHWDPIPSGTSEALRGVHGLSSDDLWAVGDKGTILHWDGAAWTSQSSGTLVDLTAVFAVSPSDVYAVGGTMTPSPSGSLTLYNWENVILHFDGTSWNLVDSGTVGAYRGVWASGPSDVWVVGGGDPSNANGGEYPVVRHFNGSTWSDVTIPSSSPQIHGIWGTGPNDVHLSCEFRKLLHYDGAWHLTEVTALDLYAHMVGVWGKSPVDMLFVGRFGTILRYDGTTYSIEPVVTNSYLKAAWGSSHRDVYAVGTQGKILHYGGDGPGWTVDPGVSQAVEGVWALSATDAVASGSAGTVLRWNGASWASAALGTTHASQKVWASSPTNAWAAVAGENALWHFDGTSWTRDPLSLYRVWRVWGRTASEVYAVADNGQVRRFNGTSWASLPTVPQSGAHLYAVWASGPNDVYVGGRYQLWIFDGSTWTSTAAGMPWVEYHGISGSGPDDVWAVGSAATLIHWDGTSWTQFPVPTSEDFNDIWVAPEGDVFAVGGYGTLLWYDGVAWSPMKVPVTGNLNAIHGTSRNDFFVAYSDTSGTGGGVLRFQGTLPKPAHGEIDWCNLQWPPATTTTRGSPTESLYGQVWVPGLTDAPGQGAGVLAEVGYGPAGSKPYFNSSWSWTSATYNVDAGNNDEYLATITPASFGTFDYAFRFSRDGGASWLYCDLDGANGIIDYSTSQAGSLTVPGCGDGVLQAGEECDDGNNANDDGCQADCSLGCASGSGAWRAVVDPGSGHCLASFTTPLDWASAEAACVGLGGHLITIGSAEENNLALTLTGEDFWIGMNDLVTEGTFVWSSGEAVGYTAWYSGEPNNYGGVEDCGGMYWSYGLWNDWNCTVVRAYLCELPTGSIPGGLILSEYVEGTGFNKYMEIYNASGGTIDLSGYAIRIYANGAVAPTSTIALTGLSLPAGSTFVLAHASAALVGVTPDQTSSALSFNGNDPVELVDGSANRVDLVGVIGDTANFGLDTGFIRNPGVRTGVTGTAWDPAQWTSEPVDTHQLGTHTP